MWSGSRGLIGLGLAGARRPWVRSAGRPCPAVAIT